MKPSDVIDDAVRNSVGNKFTSVADIVSEGLRYVLAFAGLLLLVMLIVGGIELMTSAGDQAKTKAGYGKLTAGLVGFGIIFVSYFVVQIVEVMLGVKIF